MEDRSPSRSSRRQVLKGLGVLGGLAIGGGVLWETVADGDRAVEPAGVGGDPGLDALSGAVVSGGQPRDGIPSIDQPDFVSPGEATFLADDELVFGLERDGGVRAYPQQVLVWHEIVNDTIDGAPLAVTYCPLTGTVIAFTGLADRPSMTFGTTGNLVNSNLLMYDRETDSEWPQVLGTAIRGPLYGQRLRTAPLVWSSWRAWRTTHPDTRVLSTDTGHLRDYERDPYGSYQQGSGYYTEGGPFFPVSPTDDRLPPKDVVVGVRSGDGALAIGKELVLRRGSVEADVGGQSVRAEWDDDLDTVYVVHADDGEPADFLDAMWFSWYDFYPDTEVVVS